jgi:hypothetical protein
MERVFNRADDVGYFEYPGCDLPFFRCTPYRASLSTSACAGRWRAARDAKGAQADRFEKCRGCPIGAAHAGEAVITYSAYYDTSICPRCGIGGSRMIRGELCVSCYNRQRELLVGKNAKGTAPVKAARLQPHRIRVAVDGATVSDHVRPLAADTDEVMVSILRRTPGHVMFGFFGQSPLRRQLRLF